MVMTIDTFDDKDIRRELDEVYAESKSIFTAEQYSNYWKRLGEEQFMSKDRQYRYLRKDEQLLAEGPNGTQFLCVSWPTLLPLLVLDHFNSHYGYSDSWCHTIAEDIGQDIARFCKLCKDDLLVKHEFHVDEKCCKLLNELAYTPSEHVPLDFKNLHGHWQMVGLSNSLVPPTRLPQLSPLQIESAADLTQPVLVPVALNPRPSGTETDALGLKVPPLSNATEVFQFVGDRNIDVIDTKKQETISGKWTLKDFAAYFDDENHNQVLNVLSLEISDTDLARRIEIPTIVSKLDLQARVWPKDSSFLPPRVQRYCLLSVAGSYTDFHIDFGGSRVFYHIVSGVKIFLLIPPTQKNLEVYQRWCKTQSKWLPDLTDECYRVVCKQGDTLFLPSGWIHAVGTVNASIVIGGNFLTDKDYAMQIRVNDLEAETGVAQKFRYPSFEKVMWFAILNHIQCDTNSTDLAGLRCLLKFAERTISSANRWLPKKYGSAEIIVENFQQWLKAKDQE